MFEVVKSEKGGRFPPLTEARSFRRMNPMRVLGVEFDPKLTLVIILGTLLPLIDIYDHTFFAAKSYDRFVLYFVIPFLVVRYVRVTHRRVRFVADPFQRLTGVSVRVAADVAIVHKT